MQESTVQLKGPKSPTGVKMARDHVTVGEMSHDAHTVMWSWKRPQQSGNVSSQVRCDPSALVKVSDSNIYVFLFCLDKWYFCYSFFNINAFYTGMSYSAFQVKAQVFRFTSFNCSITILDVRMLFSIFDVLLLADLRSVKAVLTQHLFSYTGLHSVGVFYLTFFCFLNLYFVVLIALRHCKRTRVLARVLHK